MSYSPDSGAATPTVESTSQLTKAGILSNNPGSTDGSSLHAQGMNSLPDISASKLTVTRTTSPKPLVSPHDSRIPTQSLSTDHMLQITWSSSSGWSSPKIVPYGPLPLDPAASCLQYATECFEGMKVYRSQHDGKLRLFRPELNAARFLMSATRIALPAFDPAEFLKCLCKFVELDCERWLPDTPEWRGKCLYLRPTMIGTGNRLGVQRPEEAMLYVIAIHAPDMSVPGGMKLLASRHDMIRAWPGGFGFAKVGANYGPTLMAQGEAKGRGYTQVLWLFGEECYVTEAGAANFFVLWEGDDGQLELVTPPLGEGIILEGVTRASILELVRQGLVTDIDGTEVKVFERKIKMSEIMKANSEGRLKEAFACGTSFFVAGIGEIDFRGEAVMLPMAEGTSPYFTEAVKAKLEDITYGKIEHEWGFVIGESW